MNTYSVKVEGFEGSLEVAAASRSKARYEAWRSFTDAWDITFARFQKIARVRVARLDPRAGYDYVNRAYSVDMWAGRRVEIINEGSISGRQGTVVYPGRSTAHVKVLLDGDTDPVIVHPISVTSPGPQVKGNGS